MVLLIEGMGTFFYGGEFANRGQRVKIVVLSWLRRVWFQEIKQSHKRVSSDKLIVAVSKFVLG